MASVSSSSRKSRTVQAVRFPSFRFGLASASGRYCLVAFRCGCGFLQDNHLFGIHSPDVVTCPSCCVQIELPPTVGMYQPSLFSEVL